LHSVVLLFLFAAVTSGGGNAEGALAIEPCPHANAALVVVRTTEHRLYACETGSIVRSYDVRLGRHGTGKTRAGDGKTPLGTYPLGAPRASKDYGIFIPIGYPIAQQVRRGLTGGAIGLHGPLHSVRWLGRTVNWFDTSDGCIGIATDDEMSILARWVRTKRPRTIVIE
jgi:murein L,D-transpeptidase YafK